jgi:hypothetical protein
LTGGEVVGPAIGDLQTKVSWVEKFLASDLLRSTAFAEDAAGSPPSCNQFGDVSSTLATQLAVRRVTSLPTGPDAAVSSSDGVGGSDGFARGVSMLVRPTTSPSGERHTMSPAVRMALHVGVLHYSPTFDVFPLLSDPDRQV